MYRRSGVGAYPTDAYYDPARPSWLPYWIDDTTESQNKAAYALSTGALGPLGILAGAAIATQPDASPYTLPSAPPTVQPPDMSTDPTGQTVNADAQIAAQVAAENAALAQWAGTQSTATPVDNTSAGAILNRLAAPMSSLTGSIPTWMILAGVGLAVFAVVKMGGR